MVKYLLFLLICISFHQVNAQQMPRFATRQQVACGGDTLRQVSGFAGWEAYQTLDNTWDGLRDTSSCFDFALPNITYYAVVNFTDVDPTKTVFVRALFNPILLNSNDLYHFGASFSSNSSILDLSDTCIQGICSGIRVAVNVPDSAGTGTVYRWYSVPHSNGFCLPTEYFDNANYLAEIIYSFKYIGSGANDSVRIFSPHIEQSYANPISGPLVSTLHGNRYQYRFDEIGGWPTDNYLFVYDSLTGYPEINNFHFIEVTAQPNPTSVDTIDVVMGLSGYQNFIFQPYTRLRGAHPSGDTINRHLVNIINDGGNFCLSVAYEKYFERGEKYEHRSGEVHFDNSGSCMLFGLGGKLVVADGARFTYGQNGRGMMALKTGSTIEIGKGAELLVGGHITMFEYDWENQPSQIYMELNEDGKLTFLPGARLTNIKSRFGRIKLNIYMNGGILDMSGLTPEDKRNINLIYPAPKRDLADNLIILPNPVEGYLRLSYNTKAQVSLKLEVIDLHGKVVFSTTKEAFEGMNFLETEALGLPTGTYILKAQARDQWAVKRFVIVN
ncbi:hypothetical protein BH09BAC1_BH09BAC1_05910 [soil metagenome]